MGKQDGRVVINASVKNQTENVRKRCQTAAQIRRILATELHQMDRLSRPRTLLRPPPHRTVSRTSRRAAWRPSLASIAATYRPEGPGMRTVRS